MATKPQNPHERVHGTRTESVIVAEGIMGGDRAKLTATATLVHLKGNDRPYFSVTGEVSRGGRVESYGHMPDEIARYLPVFVPVIRVHLSDDHGLPMHAEANAFYWMGQTKYQEYDRDALARHLRITPLEADAMQSYCKGDNWSSEAYRYMERVLRLRERWQEDADKALEVIKNDDDKA